MKKIIGIPASPGIVIGKALLYEEADLAEIPRYSIRKSQVEAEWKRYIAANQEAAEEMRSLHKRILQ
jgi:phosphotransferase system enzyme I (PtsI)